MAIHRSRVTAENHKNHLSANPVFVHVDEHYTTLADSSIPEVRRGHLSAKAEEGEELGCSI
jgi:hypothetical protein